MQALVKITKENRKRRKRSGELQKLVVALYGRLVRLLTIEYDESHDYDHHIAVLRNAAAIMNDFPYITFHRMKLIYIAAFVHDVVDHKYAGAEKKKITLRRELVSHHSSEDVELIMLWISAMSFSEQVSGRCPELAPSDTVAVNILRDADRLEALGEVGLRRCRQYSEAKNPDATPEEIEKMVVVHSKEKLVRLLPEGFIVTPTGCEMAVDKHLVIADFIAAHDQ